MRIAAARCQRDAHAHDGTNPGGDTPELDAGRGGLPGRGRPVAALPGTRPRGAGRAERRAGERRGGVHAGRRAGGPHAGRRG